MSVLSVIVPCYNEEENVPFFYEELMKNEAFFKEKALLILYLEDEPDEVHYEVDPTVTQEGLIHVGVSGRYPVEGSFPSLGGSGYRVILMPVDKELANLNVAVYMLK